MAIEAACHLRLVPISTEFKECWSFAPRGHALANSPGLTVAVIGNSAARMGIDTGAMQQALGSAGHENVSVERFSVDGSRVMTWRFILERAFLQKGDRPDAVVILCQPGALEDGGDTIAPLAQGLVSTRDWHELWTQHLGSGAEKTEFVADTLSALYAVRNRVRDRVINKAVPRYPELATDLNRVNYDMQRTTVARPGAKASTYRSLHALLAAARAGHLPLIFAVYPEFETDEATRRRNQDALAMVRQAGFDVLDLTSKSPLTPDHYMDRFHLSSNGAAIFTAYMAESLKPLLRRPAQASVR